MNGTSIEKHVCKESLQLQIQLVKAQETIKKLQKKCAEKSAQLIRLKASEKRAHVANFNLKEIIQDIKQNKWISDDGQIILNVNNLWSITNCT